jgi:hypothetical protein
MVASTASRLAPGSPCSAAAAPAPPALLPTPPVHRLHERGAYRLFLRFQTRGRVHTMAFTHTAS